MRVGVPLLDTGFAATIARAKVSLEIRAIAGIQVEQRLSRRERDPLPAIQTPPCHGGFEQQDRADRRQKNEEHVPGAAERLQVQQRARPESSEAYDDDATHRHSEFAAMSP